MRVTDLINAIRNLEKLVQFMPDKVDDLAHENKKVQLEVRELQKENLKQKIAQLEDGV